MKEVAIVELEPAMEEVAKVCGPVNNNVVEKSNVKLIIGDGREYVRTTREKYDLIFSETSNPYRPGIASLYSREFYQAVARHLNKGGIFSQWVQSYEIDNRTLRMIVATLSSVFPEIDIYQTSYYDLLFVCSGQPLPMTFRPFAKSLAVIPIKRPCYTVGG